MVTALLTLIAGLARTVSRAPGVLELAGAACVAVWAGATWGWPAVALVAGVALLAKSFEADLSAQGDGT